jgi:NADH:quinone reductase (non-electrogenic)
MFRTKITERLGIERPILGGVMMWITNPEFTAAVSEAGGLGILASFIYPSRQEFAEAIDQVRAATDKPFAVNVNLFPAQRPVNMDEYIDVILEKGVRIVETSGPKVTEEMGKRFKEAGILWMHKCVGLRYALKAERLGADIVTVVGFENGGATGELDLGTLVLVPSVVRGVRVPVIGGGGVSDGRGFAALLALGAQGVILGTRLLLTKEAPIHPHLKQALLNASELDTVLILRSIKNTHRVWSNSAARECVSLEASNAELADMISIVSGQRSRAMYRDGRIDGGVLPCGQGIGLARDIPSVKELFDRIIGEAGQILRDLARSSGEGNL